MRKLLLAAIAALSFAATTSTSCKTNTGDAGEEERFKCCGNFPSLNFTLEECCERGCWDGGPNEGPNPVDFAMCGPWCGETGETGGECGMTDSISVGDSASMTLESGPNDDGAEESGDCEPMEGVYACHGWVAGVYRRKNNPDSMTILGSSSGHVNAECYGGGDSIKITRMYQGEMENDYLFDECRDRCRELVAEGQWTWADFPNPDSNTWEQFKIVCVSEIDGNNGAIPEGQDGVHDGLNPVTGATDLCNWVGHTGDSIDHDPISITYEGPAEDDQCAPAPVCTGWQPSTSITHSLSGTTHTVTIDDAFLIDLIHDDGWRTALHCDDGSFMQNFNGSGVESWKMVNLTSGDLWYAMGFRSGDYDLKVKKTVGGTYTSLNSYPNMATAFDLLYPQETAITVQFKRPCVGTCFPTTHTTNITIN